jgi:hypothetical protein
MVHTALLNFHGIHLFQHLSLMKDFPLYAQTAEVSLTYSELHSFLDGVGGRVDWYHSYGATTQFAPRP